jgi:diguanylate cyclase (GGDEF)-like protein
MPPRAGPRPIGPRPMGPRRIGPGVVGLTAGTVLVAAAMLTTALPGPARILAANVIGLVLPVAGGLGCLRAARHSSGSAHRGWAALTAACWSWAAGQVAWLIYENVLGLGPPYLSLADVGYLAFPAAALLGLLWLAPPTSGLTSPRRVLDGLVAGCSLAVVAWIAVVGTVIANSVGPLLADAVSLAYPLSDLILLTVAVLTVAETRDEPLRWGLLGGGVLAMALSDAAYTYQAALDIYETGTVVDWGWWLAFTLIGAAGLLDSTAHGRSHPTVSRVHARAGLLPYVPLAAAVTATTVERLAGGGLDTVTIVLLVVLVLLVMLRQYVTVRQNQELARVLQEREAQLHHLAFHDGLTGLANRALFLDRLEHALDLANGNQLPVSVAFLDLDGFKGVNDSLGHATGDALLIRVAERLRGALRTADTLSRLGGDEFAVLVEQGEDATVVASGLLEALQAPFHLGGRTVVISASIGVATVEPGQGAAQAANLLHRADVAMYAVKTTGKGSVRVHTSALEVAAQAQEPDLQRAFAAALDDGAIRAIYQPSVDPRSGLIHAVEALARWNHHGVEIPPSTFVPLCEKAGLNEHLTAVVLEQACTQLREWNRALGHKRMRMAVNVNPTEFSDITMPDRIAELLERYELARGQLILEITEIAIGNRPEAAVDVMHRLRGMGLRIALDDFGTGYSTLARLAKIPLDTVKIDRCFVADIDHDVHQRRFLAGLLDLGHHLGLRTIAEGVERPGQLLAIQEMRCDLVQGFYVVRPTSGPELTPAILAERPVLPPHLLPIPATGPRLGPTGVSSGRG